MILLAAIVGLCAAAFAYMVGYVDGKDARIDMYIHEQNKRVVAENEIKALKREKAVLEEKYLAQQKKLAMFEMES